MTEHNKRLSTGWAGFTALCAAMLLMSDASAKTPEKAQLECQRDWQGLVEQQLESDALLAAWKGHESKCKGTGIYDLRLVSIYADQDDFDQARQLLEAAAIPDNLRKQAEISGICIDYLQAVDSGERARLEKLEARAATFVKANPKTGSVLAILGHARVLLGKYDQAIAPLEAVVRGGVGILGDHRNLTIAYAHAGHYQSALEMLDKTYAMSKEITSDEEFMYAAALAYAAVGKVDAAKSMLTLIVTKKPQLKDDPRFQQTVTQGKRALARRARVARRLGCCAEPCTFGRGPRVVQDKGESMRNPMPILGALLLTACATPREPTQARLEFTTVALPDYDSDRGIKWASSREEFDAARADPAFVMEQFTYVSDGLTVGAYLYRPRAPQKRPMPVIVFNRGSFVRPNGFAGEMLVMAHRYAQAGFLVVAPQYRGSNGWAGRDELGGADLHDLMNLVPVLPRIEAADTSRVFLAGESRGGAMVYMALREGFPARAAAVWGAFTDLEALIGPGGPQEKAAPLVWPDFAQRREEIIRTRSALHWAQRINVPVLIMHGGADQDIPVEQSRRMDAELTRLNKQHRLMIFDGQQHVIGERGAERDAAAVEWFKR